MKPQTLDVVFNTAAFDGHEQVVFCADRATNLRAIIAIHDTRLGPALGGCRFWPYRSEAEAVRDVLRLSRGMTYKNALAGVPRGGGKCVIMGDPTTDKTPDLLRAFARHIERLGGGFITGEDVGISEADAEVMRAVTPHVRGVSEGGVGNPSPHTAHGVFCGIRAAARFALGADSLRGVRVAVQGLGSVGMALARELHEAGARLTVADIRKDMVDQAVAAFGAEVIEANRAHAADVDIYAPCALGATVNETTIPEITAKAIAGAANNQLETAEDGERLLGAGILYAPDYVINAGGVLAIHHEGPDHDPAALRADLERIGETLTAIFTRARAEAMPTSVVADRMAEEILDAA